jgi:hypothetical protein
MRIVVSTRVKIHSVARARFADWLRQHSREYRALKAELKVTRGQPADAIAVGSDRWFWEFGGTFVSYVLKDTPVVVPGSATKLPFFVDRQIFITDIFAV